MNRRIAIISTLALVTALMINGCKAQYNEVTQEIKDIYENEYIRDLSLSDNDIKLKPDDFIKVTGDKYGKYIKPDEVKEFQNRMNGTTKETGIILKKEIINGKEEIIIDNVEYNSPAMREGVIAGGIVKEIDGIKLDTVNDKIQILNKIKQLDKETVKLKVLQDNKIVNYEIKYETKKKSSINYKIYKNIGYISIGGFKKGDESRFNSIVSELENQEINKVIIDLRNNTGGYIDIAIKMIDRIVPRGIIAQSVNKNGDKTIYNSDSTYLKAKIVVLVNERTASSAELFALSLRKLGNAILVGERTYGKGTELTIKKLKNKGLLVISTGLIYIGNENVEGVGIEPDIEISDKDLQLEKAFEIIQ